MAAIITAIEDRVVYGAVVATGKGLRLLTASAASPAVLTARPWRGSPPSSARRASGALLMVMLGNPFSGVTSAPELLPEPFGMIGQRLPPGAGGSLPRSVAFFDGSAAGGALPSS